MDLAARIKQMRLERTLRQQQVADALGFSRPTYSLIEAGERDLTIPELERIAVFFETTLAELLYSTRASFSGGPDASKYRQLIMAALFYGGNEWGVMTKYKLGKLVLFIDTEWYKLHGVSMIGQPYVRMIIGAMPEHFYAEIDFLYQSADLRIEYQGSAALVSAVGEPVHDRLSAAEFGFAKQIAEEWSDKSSFEMGHQVDYGLQVGLRARDEVVPYVAIKGLK